jgi:conjugative transfer signal peptidase TraF
MTRLGYILSTFVAVSGTAFGITTTMPVGLIWNASASAPIGFYTVDTGTSLEVADLVAMRAPEPLEKFMVQRGYIAPGLPLMKRVLAMPGQTVCRHGLGLTVDFIEVGRALKRDTAGRELPAWQGCRPIADSELFFMNWEVPDSLDGRYFGPLPRSRVIGRAVPLWTDEDGNGRFEWRAPTR